MRAAIARRDRRSVALSRRQRLRAEGGAGRALRRRRRAASCSATAPTTSSSSSTQAFLQAGRSRRSTRGTRSPCIRWPRRRAARTASRCAARDFGHDLPAMRAAITARTRIVFVANPNNPTGTWIAADGARGVHRFGARATSLVVLDEAYNEYLEPAAGAPSPPWVADHPNLVVSRTFSKAYGLAALRVGYGIMHARSPTCSIACGSRSTSMRWRRRRRSRRSPTPPTSRKAARSTARACGSSRTGLRALGLASCPRTRNFLLVKVGDAGRVYQRLLQQGVIVRPVANYGLPEWLRVTIGLPEENRRFLAALGGRAGALSRDAAVPSRRPPGAEPPSASCRRRRRPDRRLVRAGAARSAGRCGEVVGVGRGRANLDDALRLGIIDRGVHADGDWTRRARRLPTSCCSPRRSRSIRRCSRAMAGRLGRATIVTDAGSTKQDVIAAARAGAGRRIPALRAGASDRRHRALRRGRGVRDAVPRPQRRADAGRRDRPAARSRASARCGKPAARACARWRRPRTTGSSPRCRTCRTCSPSRWSTPSRRAPTARTSSASPPAAFATSRASPPARRRCGATSRSPTATRCSPRVAAFRAQLDRVTAMLEAGDGAALDAVFAHARAARRAWEARAAQRRPRRCRATTGRGEPTAAPDAVSRRQAAMRRRRRDRPTSISPRAAARGDRRAAGLEEHFQSHAAARGAGRRARPACAALLDADDVDRMLEALATLGVRVDAQPRQPRFRRPRPRRRRFPVSAAQLFLGNAGTAFRPLTAVLALAGGDYELSGVPRMHERPIGDLVDALRRWAPMSATSATPAFRRSRSDRRCRRRRDARRGRGARRRVEPVPVGAADGVAAARLAAQTRRSPIDVVGELISKPYVAITTNLMARFGVDGRAGRLAVVPRPGRRALREPRRRSTSRATRRRRRISSPPARSPADRCASPAWAGDSIQGDVAFADVLARMGADVTLRRRLDRGRAPGAARRRRRRLRRDSRRGDDAGGGRAVRARADDADRHRQLAGQGNRPHRRDGDRARASSAPRSKRAPTTCASFRPAALRPATIDTYDDHRMAMCFSLAAFGGVPVRINDPGLRAQDLPRLLRRARATSRSRRGSLTCRPVRVPVIAVDGPAASGKGTVAAGVARALGFHLLDSGALYRLVALQALRAGIALDDAAALAATRRRARRPRSTDGADPARRRRRHRGDSRRGRQRRGVAGRRASGGARGAARPAAGVPASRRDWSPTGATWAPWCSRTPRSRCS